MILLAGVANKYSRVGIWQCLTCAYLSTVILSLQIRIASSDFNIGTIDADQTDMPLPRLCLHSGVDQAHRLLYFPLDMEHFSICKTLALHLEAFAPFTAPETALGNRPMDQPAHSHCSRVAQFSFNTDGQSRPTRLGPNPGTTRVGICDDDCHALSPAAVGLTDE